MSILTHPVTTHLIVLAIGYLAGACIALWCVAVVSRIAEANKIDLDRERYES